MGQDTRNTPTRQALLISTDAELRVRLTTLLRRHFPGTPIRERRDLQDNQTVWDIRAQDFGLLLIDCRAEDRDELEFLASLNGGYGATAVIIITTAAHSPTIQSMNVGAADFLDRDNLTETAFVDTIKRAWRQSGTPSVRALPEAGSLLPPELAIKGYQPIKTLSVSSESCVLLVRHGKTNQQYVLKFLPDTSSERLVKRFLQECRIATSQHHPNLVTVHEQGLSSGVAFYVMEYLAGGSLQACLREGQLTQPRASRTIHQLAAALQHLHENNIVHLDVKSANILFRDENTAVLIDFGAARHQLINRSYTLKDHALGTPHYMSPEQATGRPLDQRSDLYALGIVLFEMLTGACPYQGDTISEVLYRHLRNPIPELPLAQRVYQPIVNRLLAKKNTERYADTTELLHALAEATATSNARTINPVTELPPLSPESLTD